MTSTSRDSDESKMEGLETFWFSKISSIFFVLFKKRKKGGVLYSLENQPTSLVLSFFYLFFFFKFSDWVVFWRDLNAHRLRTDDSSSLTGKVIRAFKIENSSTSRPCVLIGRHFLSLKRFRRRFFFFSGCLLLGAVCGIPHIDSRRRRLLPFFFPKLNKLVNFLLLLTSSSPFALIPHQRHTRVWVKGGGCHDRPRRCYHCRLFSIAELCVSVCMRAWAKFKTVAHFTRSLIAFSILHVYYCNP